MNKTSLVSSAETIQTVVEILILCFFGVRSYFQLQSDHTNKMAKFILAGSILAVVLLLVRLIWF